MDCMAVVVGSRVAAAGAVGRMAPHRLSPRTPPAATFAMINADQTLYYMSVQTMPFVRPHFRELLGAVDFAIANNYPARGEYTGDL